MGIDFSTAYGIFEQQQDRAQSVLDSWTGTTKAEAEAQAAQAQAGALATVAAQQTEVVKVAAYAIGGLGLIWLLSQMIGGRR